METMHTVFCLWMCTVNMNVCNAVSDCRVLVSASYSAACAYVGVVCVFGCVVRVSIWARVALLRMFKCIALPCAGGEGVVVVSWCRARACVRVCGASRYVCLCVFGAEEWVCVRAEMIDEKGLDAAAADRIGEYVKLNGGPELVDALLADAGIAANPSAKKGLEDMAKLLEYCKIYNCLDNVSFDLSLARGLDYYTVWCFMWMALS